MNAEGEEKEQHQLGADKRVSWKRMDKVIIVTHHK